MRQWVILAQNFSFDEISRSTGRNSLQPKYHILGIQLLLYSPVQLMVAIGKKQFIIIKTIIINN